MKTSTSKTAQQALPTFGQMVALALVKAEQELQSLCRVRCNDEHWDEADVDVDYSIELAAAHIDRMKTMEFVNCHDFDAEWFKAGGALNMACKCFLRTDCVYARHLAHTAAMFEHMSSMIEFASSGE